MPLNAACRNGLSVRFGFIPDTKAANGDPLDVLLFMDAPAYLVTIVKARLVGVIEAIQRERDGQAVRNRRLIAMHMKSLEFMSKDLRAQMECFFQGLLGDLADGIMASMFL